MKKLNLHEVKNRLRDLNLKIFTTSDLMVEYGVERRAAQAFISYNIDKKVLIRLKAGLFAAVDNLPSNFALANRIYFPSYISLDSALAHYHLIPETVYATTSVTPKSTREFEVRQHLFDYRRIKKQAFSGYVASKVQGEMIYIATPEKAVADFDYFVSLGKREANDRLKRDRLDPKRLEEYRALF